MNNEHDDPDPRDAWLREALRHAPDADAAPPPRVSETILRMGRAAVAPRIERSGRSLHAAPPSHGWMDGLAALWRWLTRPPVAAAFATVTVATVVGLMWWEHPIEDASAPREAPVAAAPATPPAEPAAAATPAPEPKRDAAPARAVTEAARKAAAATAPVAPTPAPTPALRRDMAAAKSANTGTGAPAQDEAAAQAATRLRESAERREVAAAPTAAPPAAPAAPPATAQATAQAVGKMADAAAPSALAGRAAAPSVPIETPGLSNLRFEIRRKPAAWTWQRDDGAARPVDEAFEAWITQADRTAHPQWQAGTAGSDTAATTLRFTRDGVVRAVLRLGPSGLRLTRGGKTESAELGRGQAGALLASLDALGP